MSFVISTPLSIDVLREEHEVVASADLLGLALSLEIVIVFCGKLTDEGTVPLGVELAGAAAGVIAGPLKELLTLFKFVARGATVDLSTADGVLVTITTDSETATLIGTAMFWEELGLVLGTPLTERFTPGTDGFITTGLFLVTASGLCILFALLTVVTLAKLD